MRYLAVIAFLVAITGCQGYPFSYVGTGQSTESFSRNSITGNPNVDILFVIDNSKSMGDKQAALESNANTFINQFALTNLNYHLGIVTTDMFNSNDAGRLRMAPGSTPAGQNFWQAPNPNDTNIDEERQAVTSGFVATVNILGTDGNLNEAGLLAPIRALAPSDPAVAAANAGFFRADADLAVIVLTDEDDCSFTPANAQTVAGWTDDQTCYTRADVLFDTNQLVNAYAGLKGGNLGQVRFAIIAGGLKNADGTLEPRACYIDPGTNKPSDQCGCWVMRAEDYFCSSIHTDYDQPCETNGTCNGLCPSVAGGACDTQLCHSTPARRYVDFYSALSLGRLTQGYAQGMFIDSVCQPDYAETLLSIAHSVVLTSCFSLPTATTDPSTIAVSITHGNNSTNPTVLPWYDPQNPQAACHSCADCPQGAWQYSPDAGACLACGVQLQDGDTVSVGTLNQTGTQTPINSQ